jgi:glycosyltransferase involved in cell wall biosynthesis
VNSHLCVTRKEGVLKTTIDKNVGYVSLQRKKSLDIPAILEFKKYLKKQHIGIIHAHGTSSFFAFCIKAIYPKVSIVWHNHYGKSEELQLRKQFPLTFFSFFFKSIISVNSDLKKWAEEKLFCKQVYFLNNFPFFNNDEKFTELKGQKEKRIVHLASFRAQKDHQNVLKAFNLFFKNHKDWSLHLIGKMYDDTYTKEIIDFIKRNQLENNIFVYGVCLDIKNILHQATLGVLSSKSEGLPVALLEYGLASLPVIATDVGECSKVIEHHKSGMIVEKENYLELCEAMEILALSEEKRKSYGAVHHSNVQKKYSREHFIQQLINIYKN